MRRFIRHLWLRLRSRRPAARVNPARIALCRECEFSFFNHSATLPFDQVGECQQWPAQKQKSAFMEGSRDSAR